MTILDAVRDPILFKPLFRDLSSWKSWMVVLQAIFGLEMTEEERALFTTLTGRETAPNEQAEEAWLICGRRSGKSRMASLIAVFLSCFKDYSLHRSAGERIIIMVIACDRRQAKVIFNYALAALEAVPMLAAMIERRDAESIDLNNGITIEIVTNNFRSVRGFTLGAAILDEVSYWRSDTSASPDVEVLAAIRPALATIPNSLIVSIGSPYARHGVMYDMFKRHFGQPDDPILVVKAPSRAMNPTIATRTITRAMETDAEAARSEWYAEFRSDLSNFLDADVIDRAIEVGCTVRPPRPNLSYVGFVDPSGGAHDAFTLGICHAEGERVVLDLLVGTRPPFSPEAVVREYSDLLKQYRCFHVVGDRYGSEWVREQFSKQGMQYRHSELSRSEIYLECLPQFSTGLVVLLDVPALKNELAQLERRTARSGKDSIDHGPGGHDDYANAACGAIQLCASQDQQGAYMIDIVGF